MNLKSKEKSRTPLNAVINDCFSILGSNTSRTETLKRTADMAISRFGDYITPGDLHLTDEIEIVFVELLDQLIYEFRENSEYDSTIKDYIIDDLYSRLLLILEALDNTEQYLKNLKNRGLFHDDLVIIKKMKLSEAVPLLISESGDITDLQVPIAKTLLNFTDSLDLDYYYNIFRTSSPGFLKVVSLLGLKYSASKGLNWQTLGASANGMAGLVHYAEIFNLAEFDKNRFPETPGELTLAILHAEMKSPLVNESLKSEWIMQILNSIPQYNFEKNWLAEIETSLCAILLGMDMNTVERILKDEKKLISVACLIDRLPKNIFNRITGKLDELGMEFIFNLNSIIEKKKMPVNDYNSNILSYLCLHSGGTF